MTFQSNAFSGSAKLASVKPIYKKDDRNEIKTYRPPHKKNKPILTDV